MGIEDCAKGACREKATQICDYCKFSFCDDHINKHEKKGECSIQ